ncbi:hypothetical protein [Hoeflea alexandrii]|uniref:hypothetical protein n=1 Tax=Hoeflea alexandrii TaxID=288436 RepID=UPI0022B01F2D|nr:hypothetical protein [Hoeflea alexandrii]MCZ4289457.1 hypothetical protein [Hoeflea alexandrii]
MSGHSRENGDGRLSGTKTIAEVLGKRIGPEGRLPYGQKKPNKTNGLHRENQTGTMLADKLALWLSTPT